ncbi:hypothetical protein V2I01_36875 [Micromonospora sp. BRA006-A]|nr:hypothetical protein [Micromonospora sp. BRA006-A]
MPTPALLHHGADPALRDWLLMARLPGRTLWELSRAGADVGPLRAEFGRELAALHGVTGERYGYDGDRPPARRGGTRTRPWWTTCSPTPRTGRRAAGARDPDPGAGGAARVGARRGTPSGAAALRRLGRERARRGRAGRQARLTGLVDGERYLWGDPLMDLVSPLLFRRAEDDPDDPLVRAYRAAAPFPLDAGARRRLGLYRLSLPADDRRDAQPEHHRRQRPGPGGAAGRTPRRGTGRPGGLSVTGSRWRRRRCCPGSCRSAGRNARRT